MVSKQMQRTLWLKLPQEHPLVTLPQTLVPNMGHLKPSCLHLARETKLHPSLLIFWGDGKAEGTWGHDLIKIGSTTLDSVSIAIVNESTKFIRS